MSAVFPRNNGSKLTFFYKRYRPSKQAPTSVYEAMNFDKNQEVKPEYPVDRTLEVISFDGGLEITKAIFKKIGKVRKFINGETIYHGKQAFYSFVIFKY